VATIAVISFFGIPFPGLQYGLIGILPACEDSRVIANPIPIPVIQYDVARLGIFYKPVIFFPKIISGLTGLITIWTVNFFEMMPGMVIHPANEYGAPLHTI
jgi:hypothetical protein